MKKMQIGAYTYSKLHMCCSLANDCAYTGWPKKVSHYHELSLNCIKTRH